MKRTTYIIIGLFVLGLFFIPILLQTPGGEKTDNRLSMEGERTEIEMTGIRHVKVVEKLGKIDKDQVSWMWKPLTLQVRVYLCIRKVNICM